MLRPNERRNKRKVKRKRNSKGIVKCKMTRDRKKKMPSRENTILRWIRNDQKKERRN
jgi:hypothetical protein